MRLLAILALCGSVASTGCTHRSLARHTVLTTTTVMEIQYSSVLSNLAMMSLHPEGLPNHANLADGTVQINDRAGFGQAGGLTSLGGDFGIEQFGPSAQRQVSEQWGTDATTDPERLYDLQSLYRAALGLEPLPPPNGIAYLRRPRAGGKQKDKKGGGDGENVAVVAGQEGGSSDSGNGSGGDRGPVPVAVLLTDVPPPGWYHVGCKKDVPKDACFVGRWGDRYAWVTADGVPQLARFTITALAVIKLRPGEGASGSGLAVTSP